MLKITSKGSFQNTQNFLNHMSKGDIFRSLDVYGQRGVAALAAATPLGATGEAAASWDYEITKSGFSYTLAWTNSNLDEEGTPIVVLLEYGHGTGHGAYVQGRDFINPAIAPIFDEIAADVWKQVTSS